MKKEDDILSEAVKAMKQEDVPSRPENLAEETVKQLNRISSQLPGEQRGKEVVSHQRFKLINSFTRIAAAVILLVSAGYVVGRVSAPRPPDMKQIQAALEPAIRAKLLDEVTQYVQLGLANNYVQIEQELTEQYQQDLNQAALQILNASSTITNQRLEEFIQYIATTQLQDRQQVAAAIQQIELNRLEDKNLFGSALVNFASRTDENMAVIAKYLTNTNTSNPIPNELENQNN